MYCKNCGQNLGENVSFCSNCGQRIQVQQNQLQQNQSFGSMEQLHKNNTTANNKEKNAKKTKHKKKKAATGCLLAFIIVVVFVATALIIGILLGDYNTNTPSNTETSSATQKEEKQKSAVVYEDDCIKASFKRVYSDKLVDQSVEGVVYLQLHIENKSSQTIIPSLSNVAINGMSTTSATAVPIVILPDNSSEQPFIIFTKNTNAENADDIEKIQFSFEIFDEDYHTIDTSKVITYNVK